MMTVLKLFALLLCYCIVVNSYPVLQYCKFGSSENTLYCDCEDNAMIELNGTETSFVELKGGCKCKISYENKPETITHSLCPEWLCQDNICQANRTCDSNEPQCNFESLNCDGDDCFEGNNDIPDFLPEDPTIVSPVTEMLTTEVKAITTTAAENPTNLSPVTEMPTTDTRGITNALTEDCLLLVAAYRSIKKISLDSLSTGRVFDLAEAKRPLGIDFDPINRHVFWSNDESAIFRANLDGSVQEKIVDTISTFGVAVDWINRNLYWTDASRIEMARLDGSNRLTIISENLKMPIAMVLDLSAGYIFWTACGTIPKVERAQLNGDERISITNTSLLCPESLTIDQKEQKVYWADSRLQKIEVADYDGSERRILIELSAHDIWGLTVLGDYIFLGSKFSNAIYKINKRGGKEEALILPNGQQLHVSHPSGIKAISLYPENHCFSTESTTDNQSETSTEEENPATESPVTVISTTQMGEKTTSATANPATVSTATGIITTNREEVTDSLPENSATESLVTVISTTQMGEKTTSASENPVTVSTATGIITTNREEVTDSLPDNKCYGNPCGDHGIYHPTGLTSFECHCDIGYSGTFCRSFICNPDSCNGVGTCVPTGPSTFNCECYVGYSGPTCENYICCGSRCGDHGTCNPTGPNSFECQCEPGFYGTFCSYYMCSEKPCGDHGTYHSTGPTSFECQCELGYSGTFCTYRDECLSIPSPCRNGGTCINNDGSFTCLCSQFWTGLNCDIDVNECANLTNYPCSNNGICLNTDGGFACDCTGTGFAGYRCLTDINECILLPCDSGTCINTPGSYVCRCPPDRTGLYCELKGSRCTPCSVLRSIYFTVGKICPDLQWCV